MVHDPTMCGHAHAIEGTSSPQVQAPKAPASWEHAAPAILRWKVRRGVLVAIAIGTPAAEGGEESHTGLLDPAIPWPESDLGQNASRSCTSTWLAAAAGPAPEARRWRTSRPAPGMSFASIHLSAGAANDAAPSRSEVHKLF